MNECVVQVPGWQEIAWLRHGFSTRRGGVSTVYLPTGANRETHGGDLNTGWTMADRPGNVAENRRRVLRAVGSEAGLESLVTVRQVHSAESLVAAETIAEFFTADGKAALEADGLMTMSADVLLGIQTADCVPVLVADTRLRAVAAFHAGWRGTAAGIVKRGVAKMAAELGSRAEDLIAAVGPSIGSCCYNVGEEVREAFRRRFAYAEELFELSGRASAWRAGGGGSEKLYVDLWEANRRQLLSAGLAPDKIAMIGECSACAGLRATPKYFSHRRENGVTGRMLSVIGIISPP